MKIIITGTPGTGKTTISRELGKIMGAKAIEVNKLIKSKKLFSKIQNGEMIADFGKLKKELARLLRSNNTIILESHLLSDFKLPADLAVVLRCNPIELKKRLSRRNYPAKKINENVLSEALDYCHINALEIYGERKVLQVDATKRITPKAIMARIAAFKKTRKSPTIRWLPKMGARELLKLGA
ncbi:MAG: AAA family ATPase [Candidatus Micrarchaeota archaeon]